MNENLGKMLEYNVAFVKHELYSRYTTSKYPDRKIAIISCMDTRMTELLPAALGLKNGDVKLITNAGATIKHPYGSGIYSLLIAIYQLGVDTILVIGHDDCGASALNGAEIIEKMKSRGITQADFDAVEQEFKPVEEWLTGCANIHDSVNGTVALIKNHRLMPKEIEVFGFVMDPVTGMLAKA